MTHHALLLRVVSAGAIVCAGMVHEAWGQTAACFGGARAAAEVYVLSNPLYAGLLTSLEQYVAKNASQLGAGGDAVRCLSVLAAAFSQKAFQLYDPAERSRRDAMNTQLENAGIGRGPAQSTASGDAYMVGRQLARLARGLPAAANGDFGPYQTPLDELDQMRIFAEQMFRAMMRDPTMRSVFADVEPLLKELLKLDLALILRHGAALAEQSCSAAQAPANCGYLAGTRALSKGDIAGAKQGFARMRNSDPTSEQWAVSEGVAWYKAGRLAEADEANRRALRINPGSFTAHDNLAFLLFDLRRPSEALTHWDAALQIRPEDADALAGKAIALQTMGRPVEALNFYRRAVRADGRYLDCAVMREEFFWSSMACDAAAPLIKQVH